MSRLQIEVDAMCRSITICRGTTTEHDMDRLSFVDDEDHEFSLFVPSSDDIGQLFKRRVRVGDKPGATILYTHEDLCAWLGSLPRRGGGFRE